MSYGRRYLSKSNLEKWQLKVSKFLTIPNLLITIFKPVLLELKEITENTNEFINTMTTNLKRAYSNSDEIVQDSKVFFETELTEFQTKVERKRQSISRKNRHFSGRETKIKRINSFLTLLKHVDSDMQINEDISYGGISTDQMISILQNSFNGHIYDFYLQTIQANLDEFRSNKISSSASFIFKFLQEYLQVCKTPLYKENFESNKEVKNIKEIIMFLNYYLDLLNENELPQSDKHNLLKILNPLKELIFPSGASYKEVLSNFFENSKYFPLQLEMISSSNPNDDSRITAKNTLITHNLREFLERITQNLNTNPDYVALGPDFYPGVLVEKINEIFVENIAHGLKNRSGHILKEIGFIPSMSPHDEENLNKDKNAYYFIGSELIKILKQHRMIYEIDEGEGKKFFPTLNTETLYQLYLSQISLNRKRNLSRALVNKIAGFFSNLIFTIFIIKTFSRDSQSTTDNHSNQIESIIEKNALFKFFNQMELKLKFVASLKGILAFPNFLNLPTAEVDDTKVVGRDIFQIMGRNTEDLNMLIFELARVI